MPPETHWLFGIKYGGHFGVLFFIATCAQLAPKCRSRLAAAFSFVRCASPLRELVVLVVCFSPCSAAAKTRRAPSRIVSHLRVYGLTTAATHDHEYPPCSVCFAVLFCLYLPPPMLETLRVHFCLFLYFSFFFHVLPFSFLVFAPFSVCSTQVPAALTPLSSRLRTYVCTTLSVPDSYLVICLIFWRRANCDIPLYIFLYIYIFPEVSLRSKTLGARPVTTDSILSMT